MISASDTSAKIYGIFNSRRPSRTAPRKRIVSICIHLCSRPACKYPFNWRCLDFKRRSIKCGSQVFSRWDTHFSKCN